MKPTSLPARLLALTPQGRRLFGLLATQQAEIARLREKLRVPPDAAPMEQADEDPVVLRALLRAAEAEAEFLRRARSRDT
ncbi:hypothetical protein [Roseococcus suduntuyensis]|uniref:Uncharacterized protein n=1 Tax=Roseococcus suduntuyensis TaxID=455361 RepID=A0A840AH84_9PROT|nr:hypothetical protein [Roseococcus suduntuyensis]MBB3900232.1 hypothetical protein [Roseococcus suduntuyensis]